MKHRWKAPGWYEDRQSMLVGLYKDYDVICLAAVGLPAMSSIILKDLALQIAQDDDQVTCHFANVLWSEEVQCTDTQWAFY